MQYRVVAILGLAAGVAAGQTPRRLDTTTFVVLGEGLAAGMANWGLTQAVQAQSFPAQMARQMQTAFPQPLIQAPGIGDPLGWAPLDSRVSTYPQGTVRVFPRNEDGKETPSLFVLNLSAPGLRAAESLSLRPTPPLIQKYDKKQTAINLLLGFPAMILDRNVPLWSQVEYAENMVPTMALVELGYYEALEAAVKGDPSLIPAPAAFRTSYNTILQRLRALYAEVIVTTIPDPMDTAYFTTPLAAAGNLLKTPPFVLLLGYDLGVNDYITRNGLTTIGAQLLRRKIEPLPAGSILRANVAADIRARVRALNTEIVNAAQANGAVVYDLNAYFARVRTSGVTVGSTRLTADYLGGFYSLDGVYPGTTGHALIANEILGLVNRTYSTSFPLVNVAPVLAEDRVAKYRPAEGPQFAASDFGIAEPAGAVTE